MAADALAPCVARPSAAMALIIKDKWFLTFHNWKNLNYHHLSVEKENSDKISWFFLREIQHNKD